MMYIVSSFLKLYLHPEMYKKKVYAFQVSLDLELLRLEKNSADVTHNYYLSKFMKYSFCFHSCCVGA